MNRRSSKSPLALDPVLVIGAVISIALAILFYIRQDTAPALATMAGLLAGVLTLQIQAMLEEKRWAEHESRVGKLIATIEEVPWLLELMEPMLRSAKHVEREFANTPAVDTCRDTFERCRGVLADLERGHFRAPYGENQMFLGLIENTRRTMCVTSVPAVDLTWWMQPVGREYWQAQVDALGRGVEIRRVFIYTEWTRELDSLAREQLAAGVKVRRVHSDGLAPGMRVITGIWDGTCGHELSYTAGGEAIDDSFTVSPPDLEMLMRQFQAIERVAEELD